VVGAGDNFMSGLIAGLVKTYYEPDIKRFEVAI